jgi:hypothetical protein
MFQSKMFSYKFKGYHEEERREGALGLKITSIQEEKLEEDICGSGVAAVTPSLDTSQGAPVEGGGKLPPGGGYRVGEKRESFTTSITSIIEESEEEVTDQLDKEEGVGEDLVFYSFMSSIAEEGKENVDVDDCPPPVSYLCKMESRRKYGTIQPGTVTTPSRGLTLDLPSFSLNQESSNGSCENGGNLKVSKFGHLYN